MFKFFILITLTTRFLTGSGVEHQAVDYDLYHTRVQLAEKLITQKAYAEALDIYDDLCNSYEFVFLREYQVATQIAFQIGEVDKAFHYLRQGILSGWDKGSIKKNDFLKPLFELKKWQEINEEYPLLRSQYEAKLELDLRARVKKMFSKDQRKALGAIFSLSSKAQDRYAERKFAPHSEEQMSEFIKILSSYGYPGEQLIGNDYWMSTILSHHNSISQDYAQRDTIYPTLKKSLTAAFKSGQVSPFELALIDEWYLKVKSNWKKDLGYGILEPPKTSTVSRFNELRAKVGLRPIELRNRLVEIQESTGMDFYLPGEPWIEGKISIMKN